MTEDQLFDDIKPLVEAEGCILVDARLAVTRQGPQVQVVLAKAGGLGTNDCARVHRLIRPRLEIQLASQDISLEVSSPGLSRVIRLEREYALFLGRGLSVYLKDGRSLGGIIQEVEAGALVLRSPRQEYKIMFNEIQKAKLDETQEVT